ncbi:trypsin-7 isoform X2 [Cylas formicarius]|uniref:trypsin-7 isoform X2 n=1 Tax=Cylas formicarius TaxID=197179 RepID=UPI002958918B|nr:trypsin-7 isoform X2 [Cylas formicarius]
MRLVYWVFLCHWHVAMAFWVDWKWFGGAIDGNDGIGGRVFVTMFGYPAKCERQGLSHPCTLSLACWFVGGSSQEGCGASAWLVACCVTSRNVHHQDYAAKIIEQDANTIETRESPGVAIQRRRDIIEVDDFCGLSSDRTLRKRIVGGSEADFAQFPWQAYIKIRAFQCGGVLVSRNFVATAAHCVLSARMTDILVYLGELDTQDTGKVEELAPSELHRVRRVIFHPKFRYKATQPDRYDLALLELITEAGYNFHISPICLPDEDLSLAGRVAVVAGWGKINPANHLVGTNLLRSVAVPILDIKECMAWHKIRQITVELHDEMMCAGHKLGKHDACLGDSGGPLILLSKGRWTLVGITSAGFGCGEPHQPGIYHKVSVTATWIRNVIQGRR